VQGVNTPEKAAGEGSLEKGLKNVGSKFSTIEQLVAQGAETVKERNGILPAEIIKGVSAVTVLRCPGTNSHLQPASSRGDDGDACSVCACMTAAVHSKLPVRCVCRTHSVRWTMPRSTLQRWKSSMPTSGCESAVIE
jgi:hypothetical protein